MSKQRLIINPYRPGAGHSPPFLAGRTAEQAQFKRILHQPTITENALITGLRGFGKTVLLNSMRDYAVQCDWLWVGNDLSESATLSEDRLAMRIITDLAQAIDQAMKARGSRGDAGDDSKLSRLLRPEVMTYEAISRHYEQAPGLPSDRLRAVLQKVSSFVHHVGMRGIVIAYDEAQCLSDNAEREQFPMSMLLETVSALQRHDGVTPVLLVLCGLPQVFEALTATRTYTERMFQVFTLDRLGRDETMAALTMPLKELMPPLHCSRVLLEKVVDLTCGYPYLVQFFGRELVDQLLENGGTLAVDQFPSSGALGRLDAGLFAARWNKTTDRQRELLGVIAGFMSRHGVQEFSARDVVTGQDPAGSTMHQMLQALCERGLIYRTRRGYYAFTMPMAAAMIERRLRRAEEESWQTRTDREPNAQPAARAAEATRGRPRKRSWFG